MTLNNKLIARICLPAVCLVAASAFTACSDDDDPTAKLYPVTIEQTMPEGVPTGYVVKSGELTYTELNTGSVTVITLPVQPTATLSAGVYDIQGTMTVTYPGDDTEHIFRTAASQKVIDGPTSSVSLVWHHYDATNTLVFGEIYVTGTLNAKGTSGLYDTYFTIYNNTDSVQYADGLALVESKILNSANDEILTAANAFNSNFTVGTVYVIPGNGTDVPVQPGESIKIVDQAINWDEQVPGALNHTDADFEWYDETTSATVKDTDNPAVANLDKWFCYSATIWLPSQQCNRSYALVRFPEGMNVETFLASQQGDYEYINAATGKQMTGNKCYLIKPEWIIDGVNLCPTETHKQNVLPTSVDISFAAISDKNNDKTRFGKKFARRTLGTSVGGHTLLLDTNDSANDFEVTAVK